ncbi:MAG: hypothetical protein JJ934_13460 [Pseudomonadales bacterium]|nr:hypothetical protein [Pseudomonadales bacterium]MBO6566943.1 hypothetical protein [Pseudomonadales bacterium]MBO6597712.1 hypothetical protein [Pseudomonadales bacterium]MBO6657902.1 hypothetical protein [Pseudomonadales bacterium]MBO6704027.1 hypothetical protein [Pseudomonadales bacterium]
MFRTLILLSFLLIGCATSPGSNEPKESTVIIETGERLIAQPPEGWQQVSLVNNMTLRVSDFIPASEDPAIWTTKISYESHRADQIEIDPLDLLAIDTQSAEKNCFATQQFNIYAGYENNYESAVQLLLCNENRNRQMGEIALIKAIRGNEHYYVIRLIRRIPPFSPGEHQLEDEEIASWARYMSRIYVCDDSEQHPCRSATFR